MFSKLRPWALCKRYFLTGLAVLLPVVITAIVIGVLAVWLQKWVGEPVSIWISWMINNVVHFFSSDPDKVMPEPKVLPNVGIVISLAFVIVVGFIVTTIMGRRLQGRIDRFLSNFPVINQLYPAAKQIVNFVFGEKKVEAKTVVALEYPRKGVWAIGFVTGTGFKQLCEMDNETYVNVFVPFSPLPMTGWLCMVKRSEIRVLEITFDEAMKFLFSAGVVVPPHQQMPEEAVASVMNYVPPVEVKPAESDSKQDETE